MPGRAHPTRALGLALAALLGAGCSTDGHEALGTHTARVLINGSVVEEQMRITCDQVGWVWFIESLQQEPGFTAQVRTGDAVGARLVRIQNLAGFTGSSWNADPATAPVEADATFSDGVFTITGTAVGYYVDEPGDTDTAHFEFRTGC